MYTFFCQVCIDHQNISHTETVRFCYICVYFEQIFVIKMYVKWIMVKSHNMKLISRTEKEREREILKK